MNMFCFQCQETAKNTGCTSQGVCGKTAPVSNLQDLLVYVLNGISFLCLELARYGVKEEKANPFLLESLFSTVTNVNFDQTYFEKRIIKALKLKEELWNRLSFVFREKEGREYDETRLPESAVWFASDVKEIHEKAGQVGALQTEDEDIRSLRSLILYGIKGMAAYAHHAYVLGYEDEDIYRFMQQALVATENDALSSDELTKLVVQCGEYGVKTMELLDRANTKTYGTPEPTHVELGVRQNPGILVSGHDLKDIEELLEQTEGKGVDVYTHGEMLPAHSYPAFKKHSHFVGNYGGSWWQQTREFESFHGPILMTTNCLVPPKASYKDRVYTTGVVGFEGVEHIPDREEGREKDFSRIIEHARSCAPPEEIEEGKIVGGFAHDALLGVKDKVLDAVQKGKIRKFIVMAGCDGRNREREYYTRFAEALPKDTIILTAGCAKYRYNKLHLGEIEGIPRVLDAGQCNDSYSLAVVALKLAEILDVGVNDLPIAYNIAWYEQKAVIVLLALLSLGVKNIHVGPTLPAFLSPNMVKILQEKFALAPITEVESDMKRLLA